MPTTTQERVQAALAEARALEASRTPEERQRQALVRAENQARNAYRCLEIAIESLIRAGMECVLADARDLEAEADDLRRRVADLAGDVRGLAVDTRDAGYAVGIRRSE